jgi:fucose 4-O-acetylase-like acetyltransferase
VALNSLPLRSNTARSAHIDTLRAIACLALVSYHVVGNAPRNGMELAADHWLAVFNSTFIDMRMPLFSFLSGCVFLSLERLTRSPGQLLLSKTRRLLLPMLTVGLLFWLANTVMGRPQPALLSIAVLPYAHFWFLQATFLIMASFLFLYAVLPVRSVNLAAGLMVLGALAWVLGPRPSVNTFSVIQAAYLMPFFMLGYIAAHGTLLDRLRSLITPALALAALVPLIALGYLLAAGHIHLVGGADRRALTLVIGAMFCLCVLLLSPQHPLLARLGGYSYTIYLFHVFFTAGSFEALQALAPGLPSAFVWGAGLSVGLVGPVCLHLALARTPLLSTLFLGSRLPPTARGRPSVAHSGAAQRA